MTDRSRRDRVLASARCPRRKSSHLLARLVIEPGGRRRLDIPRLAVADINPLGRPTRRNDLGGASFYEGERGFTTSVRVACACGVDMHFRPADLARVGQGSKPGTIVLRPTRRPAT